MTDTHKISSGVQSLISRLRDEGVQAGQEEANRIVGEAQKRAADIMAKAREEADAILARAHEEVHAERTAVRNALRLAARDATLELKAQLTASFEKAVRRMVRTECEDREFLRRMILAIAVRAAPDKTDETLELLLSDELFPSDANGDDPLRSFIQDLIGEVVEEGIEIKPSGAHTPGIRMRKQGDELEVDLTDEAITNLLLKYLLPRYRVYLEG